MEHANTDLFNRIFDLLDVLRNDASFDSAAQVQNQQNHAANVSQDATSNGLSKRSGPLIR